MLSEDESAVDRDIEIRVQYWRMWNSTCLDARKSSCEECNSPSHVPDRCRPPPRREQIHPLKLPATSHWSECPTGNRSPTSTSIISRSLRPIHHRHALGNRGGSHGGRHDGGAVARTLVGRDGGIRAGAATLEWAPRRWQEVDGGARRLGILTVGRDGDTVGARSWHVEPRSGRRWWGAAEPEGGSITFPHWKGAALTSQQPL